MARHRRRHPAVERCAEYYYYLRNHADARRSGRIASPELADVTGVGDSQVRKDLMAIGVRGVPRIGSSTSEVLESVEKALGFDRFHDAVVVGAGRLGGALMDYSGFSHCGLQVRGVFDSNPAKVGRPFGGLSVQPVEKLEAFIKKHRICLAILTVPAQAALISSMATT